MQNPCGGPSPPCASFCNYGDGLAPTLHRFKGEIFYRGYLNAVLIRGHGRADKVIVTNLFDGSVPVMLQQLPINVSV